MQNVKELAFLQGEDATEAFGLLYPNGGVRMTRNIRAIIDYLLDHVSEDAEHEVTVLDDLWASGRVTTKDHILLWNYAYCEIGLYLRVTKKSLREQKQLVSA